MHAPDRAFKEKNLEWVGSRERERERGKAGGDFRFLPDVFLSAHWCNISMLLTDCVNTACPPADQSAPIRMQKGRDGYGENALLRFL